MDYIQHQLRVPSELKSLRLDAAVCQLLPDYSRSRIQQWIKAGHLLVNGHEAKAKDKIEGGEKIEVKAPAIELLTNLAQDIPLDIIYSDDDVIIINKPVGLVAHPAAGNRDGTLLNALLHHFPELDQVPRAGIIHRLDKDTSGILIIARNLRAHTILVNELQKREIKREYLALAQGYVTAGGTIETHIGRHPQARTKMAVVRKGKEARTHYRIEQRLYGHTLLKVSLDTGRTHQIRVHLSHIKHPIVGDQVYGKLRLPKGASEELREALQQFKRQALHAYKLGFTHPQTGEYCEYTAPMPSDMKTLLSALENHDE